MDNDDSLDKIIWDMDKKLNQQDNSNFLSHIGEILQESTERIFGRNKLTYLNIVDIESGVPCNITNAEWFESVKTEWINTSCKLPFETNKKLMIQICRTILDGVIKGITFDKIVEQIMLISEIMQKEIVLIHLQNEISMLRTIIAKNQDLSIGILTYFWSTCDDILLEEDLENSVPGSITIHKEMHGLICRWDDPTLYSHDGIIWFKKNNKMVINHPGIECMCRCKASPYFTSMLINNASEVEVKDYTYLKSIMFEDNKKFRVKDNIEYGKAIVIDIEYLKEKQDEYEKKLSETQISAFKYFVNRYRKNFHIQLNKSEYIIFKKSITELVIPKINDSTIGWVYYWKSLMYLREQCYIKFKAEYEKAISITNDSIMRKHMDENILVEIEQIGSKNDVDMIRHFIKTLVD